MTYSKGYVKPKYKYSCHFCYIYEKTSLPSMIKLNWGILQRYQPDEFIKAISRSALVLTTTDHQGVVHPVVFRKYFSSYSEYVENRTMFVLNKYKESQGNRVFFCFLQRQISKYCSENNLKECYAITDFLSQQ